MVRINTSIYFRAYKEDYRKGGIFASLDSSELCTLIKLQSYSNDEGRICNLNGTGLDFNELTDMLRLNYRTLKKVLLALESKGLISVRYDDGLAIYLPFYVHNHTDREQSVKSYRQKRAIDRRVAEKEVKEATDTTVRTAIFRILTDLTKQVNRLTGEKLIPIICPCCGAEGLKDLITLARHIDQAGDDKHVPGLGWAKGYLKE